MCEILLIVNWCMMTVPGENRCKLQRLYCMLWDNNAAYCKELVPLNRVFSMIQINLNRTSNFTDVHEVKIRQLSACTVFQSHINSWRKNRREEEKWDSCKDILFLHIDAALQLVWDLAVACFSAPPAPHPTPPHPSPFLMYSCTLKPLQHWTAEDVQERCGFPAVRASSLTFWNGTSNNWILPWLSTVA